MSGLVLSNPVVRLCVEETSEMKNAHARWAFFISGVPTGIRTPVIAVKGRCPRPLDDGDKRNRKLEGFRFAAKPESIWWR
jgi:hypothetical protein